MALPAGFKLKTFLPPAIYIAADGTWYEVPSWVKIPVGTTLEELNEVWTRDLAARDPKEETKPMHEIYEEVLSSKGDKTYMVTFNGNWWSCECPGFSYYKHCKHLDKVKAQHTQKA